MGVIFLLILFATEWLCGKIRPDEQENPTRQDNP
jgi:hypothetical protein